jgi:predicted O-methyltransferase YrrM
MADPLGYIIDKWDLRYPLSQTFMPIQIPGTNRTDLAKLFGELGYRKGAEIGTSVGSYAIVLARHNPKCRIYCVDPWETYDGLNDWTDANRLNEHWIAAKSRLGQYPEVQIIKKYSMDAVKDFGDNSLDFVYIDANHEFPYVAEDIFYWAQKVKPGGIVSGHDYLKVPRKDGLVQVREVVDAYTEAFKIRKWFVVDECTLKRAGSWFWVKQ